MLGMSISDMITSFFGFFLSTWPMPKDTWLAYGAVGSAATCSMQGFFFQLGIAATPLYNCALAYFYLMKIIYGWNDRKLLVIEPFLHAIPVLFALTTAIAGLVLKLYNPDHLGSMCWINEYPTYCSTNLTCERGEGAKGYRWACKYYYSGACQADTGLT
jgi:hypothetical protein